MRFKLMLICGGALVIGWMLYLALLWSDASATIPAQAAATPTLTSQQLAVIQAINTLLLTDDEPDTLVLLYVNGDNNLAKAMQEYRLVQSIHRGAANPAITVRMVLDWPKLGNSRYYQVDPNCDFLNDVNCLSHYREGQNMRPFPEDLGDPANLSKFIQDGIADDPDAKRIILAMIGHGGGWSPNLRAGQPKGHDGKPGNGDEEMGGLLWDDSTESGIGNSLSTLDLHNALLDAKAKTGRTIDMLYLDACLMGMWEVADQIHGEVNYLLASESWSWTSFAYDAHLLAVTDARSTEQIGAQWMANEAAVLRPINHAYTYSLLDLTQMPTMSVRIDQLAQHLEPLAKTPEGKTEIRTAFAASDCFDSNADALINLSDPALGKGIDSYCDLSSFAGQLQQQFPANPALVGAAQAVQAAISNTVRSNLYAGGIPGKYSNIPWQWQRLGGLSIYTPLGQDENKRGLYSQLQAGQTKWDAFLTTYWGPPMTTLEQCPIGGCPLPNGPLQIVYTVYLPTVQR